MKKLVSVILMIVMFVAVFVGCTQQSTKTGESGQAESDNGETFKIGYSCNNFNDTFQTYIVDAAKSYVAENPGLSIDVQDAQEDVIKQQDQINSFIQQKVDALVVVPVDTSAMGPITKAAQDADIPLVYVNRNPFGESEIPEGAYYVGSQEKIGGEMQMEFVGEKLGGKGNICILMGILSNEGAIKRTEGVESKIKEKYPDIKVLAKETGNWQRDQGLAITENWLTAYGEDINAIIANNDEMALGALKALSNAGRKDVIVVGLDAIPDALASIEAGELAATVLQDAKGQGAGGLEIAHKAIKGEKLESIKWIPFKLITPDNLKDFK